MISMQTTLKRKRKTMMRVRMMMKDSMTNVTRNGMVLKTRTRSQSSRRKSQRFLLVNHQARRKGLMRLCKLSKKSLKLRTLSLIQDSTSQSNLESIAI